jgi:hypothetical protein
VPITADGSERIDMLLPFAQVPSVPRHQVKIGNLPRATPFDTKQTNHDPLSTTMDATAPSSEALPFRGGNRHPIAVVTPAEQAVVHTGTLAVEAQQRSSPQPRLTPRQFAWLRTLESNEDPRLSAAMEPVGMTMDAWAIEKKLWWEQIRKSSELADELRDLMASFKLMASKQE